MIIQRVNRTDAEKVYIVVKNGSGATITTGMGVRFLGATAAEIATSTDGAQVIAVNADSEFPLFAGVANQDIASLGYGLSQVWGYCNSVMLSHEGTSITVGCVSLVESFLKMGAKDGAFTSAQTAQALSTFCYKYVVALGSATISTLAQSFVKGFVRAL
jgi:hypothetical protein